MKIALTSYMLFSNPSSWSLIFKIMKLSIVTPLLSLVELSLVRIVTSKPSA